MVQSMPEQRPNGAPSRPTVDERLDALEHGQRDIMHALEVQGRAIEALDRKVDGLDRKVDGLDRKVDGLDRKVDGLDRKVEQGFARIERLITERGA